MSHKLSIRFFLDSRAVDAFGCATVLYRVRLGREDVKKGSVKRRAFTKHWDDNRQRVNSSDIEAAAVNSEIVKIENEIRQAYNLCIISSIDRIVTVTALKEALAGERVHLTVDRAVNEYYNYLSSMKGRSKLSPSTLTHYRILRDRIVAFLASSGAEKYRSVGVGEIRIGFVKAFKSFLEADVLPQSAGVYVAKLAKVGEWLHLDREVVKYNPFAGLKTKSSVKPKLSLEYDEWLKFLRFDPSNMGKAQQRSYQFALLQAFTGLAFIDALNLTPADVVEIDGRKWIVKSRSKNTKKGVFEGVPSYVVLLDEAKDVLDWFRAMYPHQILFVPQLTLTAQQKQLKIICEHIGIPRLTTHDFRKIFTNYVCMGANKRVISTALGHSTSATTEKHYFNINYKLIGSEFDKIQAGVKAALAI